MENAQALDYTRSARLQAQAMLYFAVSIAALGAVMMTLTSSPTAKGASFLWLPAALQLLAGIWLGPWRGFVAGGLGAYAAGILAYGGWGIVDIIMNPLAGGFANSMLPAFLFMVLRIDPTMGAKNAEKDVLKGAARVGLLTAVVLVLAFLLKPLELGFWGYAPPTLLLLIGAPTLLKGLQVKTRDFMLGFGVVVLISAISALIGCWGQVVGGQTWEAAVIQTGLGWFLGDTVSALLGLYALAYFTESARRAGIAS
jgi:hypothetical protein